MRTVKDVDWLNIGNVRKLLNRLSKPLELANLPYIKSTLVDSALQQREVATDAERAVTLRLVIEKQIENLKPGISEMQDKRWFTYNTLKMRYIERIRREEAAKQLNYAVVRTYDRDHNRAIEQLIKSLYEAEIIASEQDISISKTIGEKYLPRRVEFTARPEIERILDSLKPKIRDYFIFIKGKGGMGKTTLATEVVYRTLELFDAVIWTSAKTKKYEFPQGITDIRRPSPIFTISDIYDRIGDVLGQQYIITTPPEQKAEQIAKILQDGRRYLLVIDNFDTLSDSEKNKVIDYLRDVELFPSGCKVIVTGRHEDIGQVVPVLVEGMSLSQTQDFVEKLAVEFNLPLSLSPSKNIIEVLRQKTSGCPLAMRMIVAKANNLNKPIIDVLSELENPSPDSDTYELLEYLFRDSYELLSSDAKLVLTTLAILTDPLSYLAIIAITGMRAQVVELEVANLKRLAFVENASLLEHFELRDLTRHFVPKEVDMNRHPLPMNAAKYYIEYLREAQPNNQEISHQRENIIAVIEWCSREEEWNPVINLAKLILPYLFDTGYWEQYKRISELGMLASRETSAKHDEVDFLVSHLSFIHHALHQYAVATNIALTGLELAKKYDYHRGEGLALKMLGLIDRDRDELHLDEARNFLVGAYAIMHDSREEEEAKDIEGSLSVVYRKMGMYEDAERIVVSHLESAESERDKAITLTRLGTIMHAKKEYLRAKQLLNEALKINEKLDRKSSTAFIYRKLATIELDEGELQWSLEDANKAREIFAQVGSIYDVRDVDRLIEEITRKKKT